MKIVIVEDEAPIREGMGKILHKISPDYELAGKASNGLEGLKLIREVKPDLVIMDIQMPDMDGLEMLEEVRKEQIACRALVLSAYSEFTYAKKAIELGIENYILKPIKIPELKKVLKQIETEIAREQSREKIVTLDSIFLGGLNGQVSVDWQLDEIVWDKFGFHVDAPLVLFLVWLGNGYEKQRDAARRILTDVGEHGRDFSLHLLDLPGREEFIAVLYKTGDSVKLYADFQRSVAPMLYASLSRPVVCVWEEADGISGMEAAVGRLRKDMEWNLIMGEGSIISQKMIGQIETVPLKYPIDLENQARQSIIKRDEEAFKKSYVTFRELCRQSRCHPKEIKEACIRYSWAVLNTAKEYGSLQEELSARRMMETISEAVTWDQVRDALKMFFQKVVMLREKEEELSVSAMVQRALQMMQEYYSQGITLEEIARKLLVSEEYLSTQFRRQTGMTFSETIRKLRIEKVKVLLVNSTLKLSQIADMAGYSDPKYMSRVFKEEVGMLPAEYRKMN